jgi:DNA-binding MarR family transcriptional regulator
MTFKLEKNTGILIKKAARLFEQVANRNLDVWGVTYAQTIFLVRLWEQDGQTQIELTNSAGLKQPTVVRTLDRMERDKLVKRVRNKTDRRVFNFYLTDKAKKICQQIENEADNMQSISVQKIPAKKVKEFNDTLLDIITNLQQALTEND